MEIARIINNNVISAFDGQQEVVLMGKGIGFHKKTGDRIDEAAIEKIFRIKNDDTRKNFMDLVEDLPMEYVKLSAEIISRAKQSLGRQMNQNVYITLTDHICFAIDRYQKGMSFENPLLSEVSTFYPLEFKAGMEAIYLIYDATGIRMPEDEAVSIALHLVNAEYDTGVSQITKVTSLMREITELINNKMKMDNRSIGNLVSFKSYVKYMILRMVNNVQDDYADERLKEFALSNYPEIVGWVEEIELLITKELDKTLKDGERVFLILELSRWCTK